MDNLEIYYSLHFCLPLFIFIQKQDYFTFIYAEDIITIIPGLRDENRERSYDLTYYPIEPDKPPI